MEEDPQDGAQDGANRDGLAAVAILLVTVLFVVLVLIAII